MERESKSFVIQVKPPPGTKKPTPPSKPVAGCGMSMASYKQQFVDQATKQLQAFLKSDKKIVFHYHEKPIVSIIIVTYTQTALELLCFLSILRWLDSKFPYEVVVSNNGSSEENRNLLGRLINANIIHHNENKGFVEGVNCGVEQARGEYVLLLNDDAMLTYNCVQNMAKRLSSWKTTKIGVVGAQVRLLNNTIQDAGGILRNNGEAEEYSKGRNPDIGDVNFVRETNYVSGACLMTPRELFLELGMFDEAFSPGYCEESDYCLRVQEAGYRVVYDPNARVIHYEYGSGNSERASLLVKEHTRLLTQKHQAILSQGYGKVVTAVTARTTKKYRGRVLIVDDFVPRIATGDGELIDYIQDLVKKDFFVTYFPKYSGVDDWMSVYDWLPDTVEVMLYEDVGMLQSILAERPNFYDYFISKTFDFSDLKKTSAALSGKYVIQMREDENYTSPRLMEILKPTLLWVDWHIPEYDTNAGDYAVHSYCSSFQRLGFKICYWSDDPKWDQQDPKYMNTLLEQKWDIWNTAGFSFDHTISDLGGLVDLVVVARPLSIKYLPALKRLTRTPIIYYCHDLHYLREARQIQIEGRGLTNAEIHNRMESVLRTKATEHEIIKNTDLLVTVSQHERELINAELPDAKVSVWPWYCPTKPLHSDDDENGNIILFIGGMQHTPNQDAIRWFTGEIFPRVKQQVSGAKIVIIGEKAPIDIVSLHNDKDVYVKGHVPDLTPFLHGAAVLVAPVRYGAGFKGKIAVAMSHSLPVVTTSIGAEGMGLTDGLNVLVADTAEDFAEKVSKVLLDAQFRCDLRNGSIIHAATSWSSAVVDAHLRSDIDSLKGL
jgi:GT2 family glycosyltransferase